MRGVAVLAFASLGVVAVASCTLDFDSFDFVQFAAGGAGGTGGAGVGGSCEPFCDQGGGGTGGSPSGVGGEGTGGTGTGTGTGGMGEGGGCNNPNQCPPGMDTDCATRTCDMGMCGLDLTAPGAPCNDNGGDVCDGMGNCVSCGDPPTAPGGNMCPPECTGGCQGNNNEICVIECDDSSECANQTLVCPANYACQVNCTGSSACANAQVDCPATYQCSINCNASSACANATFNCSMDGPCNLSCGNQDCDSGVLNCGGEECSASCQGNQGFPTVTCNNSCNCTPC